MLLNKLHYLVYSISLLFLFIYGCKSTTTVIPPSGPASDLTRSGKFISFTSNRDGGRYNIFLAQVDPNGNLATGGWIYSDNPYDLTQNFNSVNNRQSNWSPDGRILVFSSEQSGGAKVIYAYFFAANGRIDSTKPVKQLINQTMVWDENPQFSPDGLFLVWDRRVGYDTAARDLYIGSITHDSSGISLSNIQSITNTIGKEEYDPKWSPRNSVRRVAYTYATSTTATDHEVWIIDPLSPSTNNVFYNPNRNSYPAWAPACDRIIFESDHGNGGYYAIVYLGYPTNNGTPTDVANDASSQTNDRYPTWLPNGGLLAFIKIPDATLKGNIFIIPSSGGTSRALLPSSFDNSDNLYPAW